MAKSKPPSDGSVGSQNAPRSRGKKANVISPKTQKPAKQPKSSKTPLSVVSQTTNPKGSIQNLILWEPGQSGNPKGWGSEYTELRRLFRERSPEAARRIIELVQ